MIEPRLNEPMKQMPVDELWRTGVMGDHKRGQHI
jgi:hypothetical protein